MPSKFLLKTVFTLVLVSGAFSAQAQSVVIPNELGAPQAGGLPREQSPDYEILYGSVRVGQEIQRVIVTKPPGAAPKPALFFIGGLGCYSLDFSGTGPKVEAYQRILDFVTKLGFVTMRVEKTGMGDSGGTSCAYQDFHREVAGNLAGIKALASYKFVNSKQIHIFGHSIGGVIAPLLAAEIPVKGIAVLGTLATDWYTYDVGNARRQYLLSGMHPSQVQQAMVSYQQFSYEFYVNKKTPEQFAQELPHLVPYLQLAADWTYMQQLSEVQPQRDWNRSNSDVLIISGVSDFIGSQGDELQQMVQETNKTRKTPLRFVSIPQLDHFFRTANTQQDSVRSNNSDGTPMIFQEYILTVIQKEFLKL